MKLQWPAPAKLNLFLYITGRRADGYHLIQTLFQFLDYGDTLTITTTNNGRIRLLNPITGIEEHNNIIVRAAKLLKCYCWSENDPLAPGADIQLVKTLPIGGGLGGGSSDASTVLLALNAQWKCGLDISTLIKLGLSLGADLPVFIKGKTAFAEGIGEDLTPVVLEEKWYLVAVPPTSVTTQFIFNNPGLKRDTPRRPLNQLMNTPFYNDCEPVVRKCFPVVELHLSWLLEYAPSRITGTGSCVFAEFDTETTARQVLLQTPSWFHGFVAKGVKVSPLHRALLEIP